MKSWVFRACANSGYQATFPSDTWPGYEASFESLQPFTVRKIGDFPHFLSALPSNNQFIIKLWPGGTLCGGGTLKIDKLRSQKKNSKKKHKKKNAKRNLGWALTRMRNLPGLCCNAVDKTFQQWLCVEKSSELCTVADLEIQNGGFSHWRAKRVRKFFGCHTHFWSRWKSELNISKQL